MKDNVGIAELSSPMLRDLIREACSGIGRVVHYATLDDVKAALLRSPPKVLVIGGAPLDRALLDLVKRAMASHGVIALAVADAHDLQLAAQAGVVEGFSRTPEGLRQLAQRVRPLLAPSLRPAPGPSHRAPSVTAAISERAQPDGASSAALGATSNTGSAQCALIAIGSFAARGDALGYLLSRLPNTLPGIVLVHGHVQPTSELVHMLSEECSWRIHEAGAPGLIQTGSLWILQRNAGWQVRLTADGLRLARDAGASGGNAAIAGLAAIDTFFERIAQALGDRALGVVLGATGDEGSHGLWALRRAGSYTLAQRDPGHATLESWTHASSHPTVANEVLGLDRLPQAITAYCQGQNNYRSLRPQDTRPPGGHN